MIQAKSRDSSAFLAHSLTSRGNYSTDAKYVKFHTLQQNPFKQQKCDREGQYEFTPGEQLNSFENIENEREEITIDDISFTCLEEKEFSNGGETASVTLKNISLTEITSQHDRVKSFGEESMADVKENLSAWEETDKQTTNEFTNPQQETPEECITNRSLSDTVKVILQLEEGRKALVDKLEDMERRLNKGKKTKDKLARDKQFIQQIRVKITKLDARIANERENETTKRFQERMSLRPKTPRKKSGNSYSRNPSRVNSAGTVKSTEDSAFRSGNEERIISGRRSFARKSSENDEFVYSSCDDRKSPTEGGRKLSARGTHRSSSAALTPDIDEEDGYSLPMAWVANKETRNEPCVGSDSVRQGLEIRGQTPLPVEIYSELLNEKDKKRVAQSTGYLPPIAVQKNFWDKEIFEDPPMIREDEKTRISYFPNRRRLLHGRARVYLKQEEFLKFHKLGKHVKKSTDSSIVQAARELDLEEKSRKPKPLPVHFM